MPNQDKWDAKIWVITILTALTLGIGGYSLKTLAGEVHDVKAQANSLAQRQAVDDERFEEVRKGLAELKVDLKDVRDLLVKTHMKELKKEGGGK